MTTILIKKKDTAGAPAAGDLTNAAGGAEIAVNTATKRIYTKDAGGNVVELGTNPSALTTNLLFSPDATYDIGASGASRPRDQYLSRDLAVGRNLTVGGTFTVTGGINFNGNVTVGDSSADTLTINSTITSNLIFTDNTYDIGAAGATRPRSIYLAGNATLGGASGVFLTANAAKFQSTYGGVTTTNLFTDSNGGVLSVDGSNTISLRTGGISGTSVAVVASTGLTVYGTSTIYKAAGLNTVTELLILDPESGTHVGGKGSKITFKDISVYATGAAIEQQRIGVSTGSTLSFRLRDAATAQMILTDTQTGYIALGVNGLGYYTGGLTVGSATNPGSRFAVVSSEAKTSPATPMIFSTSTAGSADFQLVFSRSAAGAGAYYKIQSVEQSTAYRDLVLQVDGGNVGIRTSAPAYTLQLGTLGTGVQYTMYIPGTFNWDGAYLQPGTSAQRGAALILASHTNTTNATGYKFLADNDTVARQLQLQYASDATSLSAASFSTKFWFDGASASPAIGIGKAPSYPLDVAGTINGTGLQMVGVGADFLARRVSGDAYPVAQLMQKARGTPTSVATVQNGDGIGVIYFQPYVASSGYIFPATIQGVVNGSVTGTSAPTDIVISTGSSSATEALRVTSGQFVGIRASAPTNMLDVSGTIGKDYTSNVTVAANNTATIVVDAFNGNNFSAWVQAQFYGVGNNRWSGIISIDWDTGGSASCASFSISKHSGFNGVNITQLSATNYNGATTTDGSYIYLRNAGGVSITPVFTFILLASS